MRKSVSSTLMAAAVSALALSPVAIGATLLTADTAYAKNEKSNEDRGNRESRGKSSEKREAKSSSDVSGASAKTLPANNWKTRLGADQLSLSPSEYGKWNSARRSPVAIANMAEKYRAALAEGRTLNGAGAMIGQFVVAYEDYNTAQGSVVAALQAGIDSGDIAYADALAFMNGDMTPVDLDAAVEEFNTNNPNVTLTYDGSSFSCADGDGGLSCGSVDTSDLEALKAESDLYDSIAGYPGVQEAIDKEQAAEDDLLAAQSLVDPKSDGGDAVAMLGDIEKLLGVSAEESTAELVEPAPVEPIVEGEAVAVTE